MQLAVSAVPGGHEEHVEGLLDIGTTRTCISNHLVERLGVEPSGEALVTGLDTEDMPRSTVPVHLRVPAPQIAAAPAPDHFSKQLIAVEAVRRFEGRLPSAPCDVLIGMDLIARWHVEITNGVCTITW